MIENGVIAINNHENTCVLCLDEYPRCSITHINIPSLGYNSAFDNLSTRIVLCKSCLKKTDQEWWKLETIEDDDEFGPKYIYEDEILQFIDSLTLAGKESVWNHFAYGACANYEIPSQDYIDLKLGVLSHEKCKQYGFYSPDEKEAYKSRFPKCQFPVHEKYYDGSVGCRCHKRASGKVGQVIGLNTSQECFNCKDFRNRTLPILEIEEWEFNAYCTYVNYHCNKEKLEKRFSEMLPHISNGEQ